MQRRWQTPWPVRGPTRAFHVAAEARARLGIEESWVSLRGDVLLADFERAALVAGRLGRLAVAGDPPLRAADLYAGALLEEVYHLVIARYLSEVDPEAFRKAEVRARAALGEASTTATLHAFVRRYPPPDVARGITPAQVLERQIDGVSGAQVALEEAWTCYLANANPALAGARPLIDLAPLRAAYPFDALIASLREHFSLAPGLPGPSGRPSQSLFTIMLEPLQRHPHDVGAQLRFVRDSWGLTLGKGFVALVERLLDAVASVREADVMRGSSGHGVRSQRVVSPLALRGGEAEPERFSADGDWMPRVVMVAKSVYVWLDQLEQQHQTPVRRLDQVPDAALAELAQRGFNALWLIGVWQRSRASRRIKQLRGQEDALASAYALDDYTIALDLGGEAAFAALKERAARVGVRMATDMVPNHVGIDGRWLIEHPERFVQLSQPPYPSYRFEGPNLSDDPRAEVRIDDRYYEASDAAVVFERIDTATGERRFIYHGNDGTLMPWNDTAQLDYLRADVREAVIRTIIEVARRSPIIRFDAAMTLAKRHVRRLWYPAPGEGGGVPSRGRYGALSDEDFEAAMPTEFWREVVDRIAAEVPDTLLLAEAFWMLEGYFVRTLGMHRVYNSAFMHMLRDQDNAGYRALMREVLRFDPRILQRYVNFMNNPDEETAREQFGDGDRYFAVTTLLATLPGLPMFGHGQFEGFREKYGMEYRRAKRAELPDPSLVARHERELSPLLHRRWQFAAVAGFRLFDGVGADGVVNEDLFAYANRVADATSLVLINHRAAPFEGTLHESVEAVREPEGPLLRSSVAEALGLRGGDHRYLVARDLRSGFSLVRSSDEVIREGWRCLLNGFEGQVWVDVEERLDAEGMLARVAAGAGYHGVPSLEDALEDARMAAGDAALAGLWAAWWGEAPAPRSVQQAAWQRWCAGLGVAEGPVPAPLEAATLAALAAGFEPVLALLRLLEGLPEPLAVWRRQRLEPVSARLLQPLLGDAAAAWACAIAGVLATGPAVPARDHRQEDAWLLAAAASSTLQLALGVHKFEDVVWFSREAMERWLRLLAAQRRVSGSPPAVVQAWLTRMTQRMEASGYRWERWLAKERAPRPTAARTPGQAVGEGAALAGGVAPMTLAQRRRPLRRKRRR